MNFNKVFLFNCFRELNQAFREPCFAPSTKKTLNDAKEPLGSGASGVFGVGRKSEAKFTFGCGEKIALGISDPKVANGYTNIRAWHANTYFGIWHDSFESGNFLAALDYRVCDDHIKIEYMNIYDQEYLRYQTHCRETAHLNAQKAEELNHAMLDYITNQARTLKKPKVIVDVHHNLRIFDIYYKPYGFVATNRKCLDNGYWLEAELKVEPQKSPDTI